MEGWRWEVVEGEREGKDGEREERWRGEIIYYVYMYIFTVNKLNPCLGVYITNQSISVYQLRNIRRVPTL